MTAETQHQIESQFETLFQRDYAVHAPDMRRLYENAKRDQWNVSTDIDWSQAVELEKTDPQRNHYRQVELLTRAPGIALDKIIERASPAKHSQNYFLNECAVLARQIRIGKSTYKY